MSIWKVQGVSCERQRHAQAGAFALASRGRACTVLRIQSMSCMLRRLGRYHSRNQRTLKLAAQERLGQSQLTVNDCHGALIRVRFKLRATRESNDLDQSNGHKNFDSQRRSFPIKSLGGGRPFAWDAEYHYSDSGNGYDQHREAGNGELDLCDLLPLVVL